MMSTEQSSERIQRTTEWNPENNRSNQRLKTGKKRLTEGVWSKEKKSRDMLRTLKHINGCCKEKEVRGNLLLVATMDKSRCNRLKW